MKDYTYVDMECYSYHELLEIYENKYKQDYQLIGYEHNCIKKRGILVLSEKEKKR